MGVLYYKNTTIEKRRCAVPDCGELIEDLHDVWVNEQGEYVFCPSCRSSASSDFQSHDAWRKAFTRGTEYVSCPDVINDMEE